jgi:hypothetical protein
MPPLTHNPNTFYAEVGSEDDIKYLSEAQSGNFATWRADTESVSYHVYAIPGDIPSAALRAMARITKEKNQGEISVRKERLINNKTIAVDNVIDRIEE